MRSSEKQAWREGVQSLGFALIVITGGAVNVSLIGWTWSGDTAAQLALVGLNAIALAAALLALTSFVAFVSDAAEHFKRAMEHRRAPLPQWSHLMVVPRDTTTDEDAAAYAAIKKRFTALGVTV